MIELYQAEWCPHSRKVRERLTELGVDFVARQVEPIFTASQPPDRRPALGYGMTLAAALLFGFNGAVSKVVLDSGLGSLRLSEVRSTGAALGLLLGLALLAPARLRVRRPEWRFFLLR